MQVLSRPSSNNLKKTTFRLGIGAIPIAAMKLAKSTAPTMMANQLEREADRASMRLIILTL